MELTTSVCEAQPIQAFPTKAPLVRVVENNRRSLPLTKFKVSDLEEEDEGLLEEATESVVTTLMFDAAEKLIEDACKSPDYSETIPFEPQPSDPEVEELVGDLIGVVEADMSYSRSSPKPTPVDPTVEKLMRSDTDDIEFYEEEDLDAAIAFDMGLTEETEVRTQEATAVVAQETEQMKNEPIVIAKNEPIIITAAAKQAEDKGTLQYLKSVEGRVLTIMEAAFPNAEQRDAVKSLIKKEFRREITKATRGTTDED
jgi:hypothetical protein